MDKEQYFTETQLMWWYLKGIADKHNINISKYDPNELVMGFEVEKEHNTPNKPEIDVVDKPIDSLKIAITHLDEDPKYYTKLKKIEESKLRRLITEIEERVVRRLKEDAETDYLMRDQAMDVLDDLIEYLKNGNKLRKDVGGFQGFYLYLKDFSEYEKNINDPLKIVFTTKKEINGTPMYSSLKKTIFIPIFDKNPGIIPSEKDKKVIYKRLKGNYYKAFIHEYIHYLDNIRIDLNLDNLSNYDDESIASHRGKLSIDNPEIRDYFSDPLEVNAYFQQAMTMIHQIVKDGGPLLRWFKRKWDNDFRKFKSWFFDEELNKYTKASIDQKQYKRIVKRLYGFWKNYIKE